MIITITGKLGSGKTTAAKIFKKHGANIIDADKIAHTILNNKEFIKKLVDNFGSSILQKNNKISRKKLGLIAFNNPKKLKRLNTIIHPHLIKGIRKSIKPKRLNVIDAVLYKELKLKNISDKTVLIKTKKNIVVERLKRHKYNKKLIEKILKLQHIRIKPDFIINNNRTEKELKDEVEKIISIIK